ncbi:MAG TPA: hypothetical protein VK166_10325 [Chitinophagaceae bacterium]|nr:hypothetical protein [Chitinophagaceae bacterium]
MIKTLSIIALYYLAVGFYSVSAISTEGKTVSMATYKDKTVVIALVDAVNPDLAFLSKIGGIANTGLQVIIQPLNDLSTASATEAKTVSKNLGSNVLVLKTAAFGSRDKAKGELIYWLANADQNGHFQIDAVTANTVFVVSKDGELKSVLAGGFPDKALTEALQ